jgi:hypothetical protein
MAVVGRILIIPQGNYNPDVEYDMLDLVFHNGTSWICHQKCKGVEPNESNSNYWEILVDVRPENIDGLDEYIDNRIAMHLEEAN